MYPVQHAQNDCLIDIYGRLTGGGGHFWGFDAKWEVFRPLSGFRPEVGMDFAQKLVPPYFRHGEFKNQGFVAQQNSGRAIRGAKHGQFSGNLLLLAWHTYKVFTVLGPVLKHIVTMANDLLNYAKFHAESWCRSHPSTQRYCRENLLAV